jgi:hypothetical protein
MRLKGFSLTEVLIAGSIALFLLVPIFWMNQQSRHKTQQSLDEIRASFYAQEVIEQFKTMKGLIGYKNMHQLTSHDEEKPSLDMSKIAENNNSLYCCPKNFEIHAHSKLYLSDLPENYRRTVRFFPINQTTQGYTPADDMKHLEVMIEWKSPGSVEFNRRVVMASIINYDRVLVEAN